MNDFVNKYKMSQGGIGKRQQGKENKKGVTKALHDTFNLAKTGQVGGIQHEGVQYLMLRQDVFQNIIQNGGQMLVSEEQKAFHKEYQVLLNMMQSLNIEDPDESELFDEIDQFSFDFSQNMNDPKGKGKRLAVLKEFEETLEGNELLASMAANFRKQLFPQDQKEEEAANNGKLT